MTAEEIIKLAAKGFKNDLLLSRKHVEDNRAGREQIHERTFN